MLRLILFNSLCSCLFFTPCLYAHCNCDEKVFCIGIFTAREEPKLDYIIKIIKELVHSLTKI